MTWTVPKCGRPAGPCRLFPHRRRPWVYEGVCNHLSFMVPGHDDLFLVNPDGRSFAEITVSRLLI